MVISTFLVEDRADIRLTLMDAMEEIAPIKFVGQAATEAAARKWLSANDNNWDLAIVDLFLGEGTGFGVLKDVQMRSPRQKVVVLTSYGQKRVLDHCMVLGADEVFDKSEDVDKLVDYCKNHAANLDSMDRYGMITRNPTVEVAAPDLYAS
ncbi:MAG: response regulator [Polaromonas sp.]|nr:response regulator [Polaromonas sp.]